MTRIKGGCALSVKRNRRKKGKIQEDTEETTSDDVSLSKGESKGKDKEKGKGKGRTCHKCGEQGHCARECPAQGQELAPAATAGAVQHWLYPEAVELLEVRKFC